MSHPADDDHESPVAFLDALLRVEDPSEQRERIDERLLALQEEGVLDPTLHEKCVDHVCAELADGRPGWREALVALALRVSTLQVSVSHFAFPIGAKRRGRIERRSFPLMATTIVAGLIFVVTGVTTAIGVVQFSGYVFDQLGLNRQMGPDVTLAVSVILGAVIGVAVSWAIRMVKRGVAYHRLEKANPDTTMKSIGQAFWSTDLLRSWRPRHGDPTTAAPTTLTRRFAVAAAAGILIFLVGVDGYTNFTGAATMMSVYQDRADQLAEPKAEIERRIAEVRTKYETLVQTTTAAAEGVATRIVNQEELGQSENELPGRGPVFHAKRALFLGNVTSRQWLADPEQSDPLRRALLATIEQAVGDQATVHPLHEEVHALASEAKLQIDVLVGEVDGAVEKLTAWSGINYLQDQIDKIVSDEDALFEEIRTRDAQFEQDLDELMARYRVALDDFAQSARSLAGYPVKGEVSEIPTKTVKLSTDEIKVHPLRVREGFSLLQQQFDKQPALGFLVAILAIVAAFLFSYSDLLVAAATRLGRQWSSDWAQFDKNATYRDEHTQVVVRVLEDQINDPADDHWLRWGTSHEVTPEVLVPGVEAAMDEVVESLRAERRGWRRWRRRFGFTERAIAANVEHDAVDQAFHQPSGLNMVMHKILEETLGEDPYQPAAKRVPADLWVGRRLHSELGLRQLDRLRDAAAALMERLRSGPSVDGDDQYRALLDELDALEDRHTDRNQKADEVAMRTRDFSRKVPGMLRDAVSAPDHARYAQQAAAELHAQVTEARSELARLSSGLAELPNDRYELAAEPLRDALVRARSVVGSVGRLVERARGADLQRLPEVGEELRVEMERLEQVDRARMAAIDAELKRTRRIRNQKRAEALRRWSRQREAHPHDRRRLVLQLLVDAGLVAYDEELPQTQAAFDATVMLDDRQTKAASRGHGTLAKLTDSDAIRVHLADDIKELLDRMPVR